MSPPHRISILGEEKIVVGNGRKTEERQNGIFSKMISYAVTSIW
jgi:hypothetical protein